MYELRPLSITAAKFFGYLTKVSHTFTLNAGHHCLEYAVKLLSFHATHMEKVGTNDIPSDVKSDEYLLFKRSSEFWWQSLTTRSRRLHFIHYSSSIGVIYSISHSITLWSLNKDVDHSCRNHFRPGYPTPLMLSKHCIRITVLCIYSYVVCT